VASRREFLLTGAAASLPPAGSQATDRAYWLKTLSRITEPVLTALSARKLKLLMPVEAPHGNVADRAQFSHLEAFGRLMAGIAPWLELSEDAEAQRYAEIARKSIAAAVDPASPDFMNFNRGAQPVVDAAFLALALLRAPKELWGKLDAKTRSQLLDALRATRVIKPGYNNWLLFSATIEAFFCTVGEPWDQMRVDYAIRKHDEWYKGDGLYGDGPQFHWDYYNSFVIHPMLLAVLDACGETWKTFHEPALQRARRYAIIQERLIAPDGSFPAIGRSLAYRCGAFHHLATMALRERLPMRSALTAVIKRCLDAPGTFDTSGWLTIGLCGHQPQIAEPYISTGSTYLCTAAFLPLGLPSTDVFWTQPGAQLTSQKVWSGVDVGADHALSG
jgi:hypothetical protein